MRFFLTILCIIPIITWAEPLPAKDIFQLEQGIKDANTLLLKWTIKPGYFLYKNRVKITANSEEVTIGNIAFPKAKVKTFQDGKSYSVYRKALQLVVPVLGQQPGELYLQVSFQGCADDGFCYPPEKRQVKISFNKNLELFQAAVVTNGLDESRLKKDKSLDFDEFFSSNSFILVVLGFLGFGLLLSFTPCVLPMVPILSGLIVGHGQDITTRKSFLLSLSYVLSMSLTYALVGGIVATLGSNLQIIMQSAWAISVFAIVFVLLALSMFGFYELQLPLSWQNRLASVTRSHAGGHYLGAAIMGCLSTLILSPCVTAPLVGALGYIANTGDILLGTVSLFFLGFGMGLPLLLIGLSAGKLLPKAGNWMNEVKSFFGVLLLAMAIYLLDRILPTMLIMGLWGSLLIFCGIFLGTLKRSLTNLEKFNQALGIICLVYGILILVGGSLGNSNPLKPLASLTQPNQSNETASFHVVKSLSEVKNKLTRIEGKPVILDFYADWCSTCKSIARTTLKNPQVQQALKQFVVIKIDVTENNANAKRVLNYYDVIAPPTFIFLDGAGNQVPNLKLVGGFSTEKFMDTLKKARQSP